MDKIALNPDRLRWACQDRGITPAELAAEAKIAPATIEKVLAGETGLTFNQLRRVANVFNRPGVLFFVYPEPVEPNDVHTPQFRTLRNKKPALSPKIRDIIERVERQRDIYLALRDDLDEAQIDRFDPPDLPRNDIAEAAAITRQWLGLGDQKTFEDYRQAVEARGILVFRSNGYKGNWQIPAGDEICGFNLYDEVCPVIFVKKEWYAPRQTFTMMHELGHILLHHESSIDDVADIYNYAGVEREANTFASQVLVPESALEAIDDSARPLNPEQYRAWLRPVVDGLGVSVHAVLLRLLTAGRLPRASYDIYVEWAKRRRPDTTGKGNRQHRYREPRHVFGDTFVRTVLDAFHESRIPLTSVSKYLDNIKLEQIYRLEGYYAGN